MSEVLGTILVLLITVIIFSAIILWVSSLPPPVEGGSVGFDGFLTGNYDGGMWDGARVNITHVGGEDLHNRSTRIYLRIDNTTEVLRTRGTFFDGVSVKPYGIGGPDDTWHIGEEWSLLNESILQGASVSVLVVDIDRGIVLWQEALLGVQGVDAPVFLDKWYDSNITTANRDRITPGDIFTVFATVVDPDGDLHPASVWAYLTFGTNGTPLGYIQLLDDGSGGDKVANDGTFSRTLPYQAQQAWDGGIIILNATDTGGRPAATRLTLRVGSAFGGGGGFIPFGGTWNNTLGGIGQGDSGPNGDQGWNIYNATGLPSSDDPAGSPTRTFLPGETVYVVVRATLIQNAANINSFVLRDATGFTLYPPTREFDSRDPTKNDPAFTQTATSPYFEYQYSFAAPASDGLYSVELTIKDNAGHAFLFGTDNIWVGSGGSPPTYPRLVTYRDPNRDGNLSDLQEWNSFNITDPMYIRIFVQDRDNDLVSCGFWFPPDICPFEVNNNAGDVELLDYYGSTPIKKRPGNAPVSLIALYPYDLPGESTYLLYINLLRRDQDSWLGGANFYTLRIRTLADFGLGGTTAESYFMLSRQVQVVAPQSTVDIVSTTEQGTGENDRGVYWHDSSHGWQEHNIDLIPEDLDRPLAMATGDLNGDSKVDVAIGLDSEKVTNIIAYFNLDYGLTWRREFINQFGENPSLRAESLAIGDLDGDGDGELVAGVRSAVGGVGVVVFWNDGVWSGQDLQFSGAGSPPPMRSIALGDINDDGRLDVVAGDDEGRVDFYCNNVRGSYLPGADTPCPGQTSLAPPGDPSAFNRGVQVGIAGTIERNSLRLGRMEGPEASDPSLDIVVSNGANLIIYRTELSGGAPSWIRYDVVEGGTPITLKIWSLDVGDMNNDGMLDIVAAIEPDVSTAPGVYRLRNRGMDPGPPPTFNAWLSELLPHTTIDPATGSPARLGRITDLSLGDTDNDGDLDIVFIGNAELNFLNNLWHLENRGDVAANYVETNVYTDGFFERREKAFAVETDFIDL